MIYSLVCANEVLVPVHMLKLCRKFGERILLTAAQARPACKQINEWVEAGIHIAFPARLTNVKQCAVSKLGSQNIAVLVIPHVHSQASGHGTRKHFKRKFRQAQCSSLRRSLDVR
jgi:hypothetical protein